MSGRRRKLPVMPSIFQPTPTALSLSKSAKVQTGEKTLIYPFPPQNCPECMSVQKQNKLWETWQLCEFVRDKQSGTPKWTHDGRALRCHYWPPCHGTNDLRLGDVYFWIYKLPIRSLHGGEFAFALLTFQNWSERKSSQKTTPQSLSLRQKPNCTKGAV